jgi:hypothetical protein
MTETQDDTHDTTDVQERLDRLESLVEQQQERIDDQQATIEAQRERIAELDGDDDDDGTALLANRRNALKAGGLLALLFGSVGTASADSQGQVGTSSDPLNALYTKEINGTETIESPSGTGLTLNTDDGSQAFQLASPSERVPNIRRDVVWREGANLVAGDPQNTVTNDASGVVIGGGGEYLVGSDANQIPSDTRDRANTVSADYATLAGGRANEVSGRFASLGGGAKNTASGENATVGGGNRNTASGNRSTVAGGNGNTASGGNTAAQGGATVGGGEGNEATGSQSTVAGGSGNKASASRSTVGGGDLNEATRDNSTVSGGDGNTASSENATVSGGTSNEASGKRSTVGGGDGNTAKAEDATIGGGSANLATGQDATIGGGSSNTASGRDATVPGGFVNVATGERSLAMGQYAAAENKNAFVWNDGLAEHEYDAPATTQGTFTGISSSTDVNGESVTGSETFSVSATGGVRFITGSSSVTYIDAASTGWSTASSRTVKTNIQSINPREALAGVEEMEVATWEYEDDNGEGAGTTHIGPMAEDFHDAFDVGSSDKHINSINSDGVALAAIQGLSSKLNDAREELDDKDDRIDTLEAENADLRERNAELEARIDRIETELGIDATADRQEVADD